MHMKGYTRHKIDQEKLKKACEVHKSYWLTNAFLVKKENGQSFYTRFYDSCKKQTKHHTNSKLRHLHLSEDGVSYPIKGCGYKKVSTQYKNWLY